MASRWKGEIERLQAESQQVIDNCLRRARKKFGNAREVELQMAAKHVGYIKLLETAYREIRRLVNTVWPLHGMTLVKRLRGEGRVKSAAAIGQRGGAVVNDMLQKYMSGVDLPSLSSVVSTQTESLPSPSETIVPTPTPETRKSNKRSEDEGTDEPEDVAEEEEEHGPEEEEEIVEDELTEDELEDALELGEE
jgi:hypothetical protein